MELLSPAARPRLSVIADPGPEPVPFTPPPGEPLIDPTRVEVVHQLRILQRVADPALQALARIAGFVTGAPCAAIHIIDDTRQQRIAAYNAPLAIDPIENSMCREVVRDGAPIICRDASRERRFGYSAYTKLEPPVRFYASFPLTVEQGQVVGTLCTFGTAEVELSEEQTDRLHDIAIQAQTHIELIQVATDLGQAAMFDPLTGAANRTTFDQRLGQALESNADNGVTVAVFILDMNGFKALNDERGHAEGDAALCALVQRVRTVLRPTDLVGRLGGDEFGVVVETRGYPLEALLYRLKAAMADPKDPIDVAIGGAAARPGETAASLLTRADQAMYAAKRQPRLRRPA